MYHIFAMQVKQSKAYHSEIAHYVFFREHLTLFEDLQQFLLEVSALHKLWNDTLLVQTLYYKVIKVLDDHRMWLKTFQNSDFPISNTSHLLRHIVFGHFENLGRNDLPIMPSAYLENLWELALTQDIFGVLHICLKVVSPLARLRVHTLYRLLSHFL